MEQNKTYFKIEQQVLQSILDYLATRPFREVVDLINTIQRSEIIAPSDTETSEIKQDKKQ